jgi:deazaflavin-dependent oxidoreductase (nitroreductase family)
VLGIEDVSTERNPYSEFNERLMADLRAHRGRATSGPFVGRDLLILTTVGARTGAKRENPLVFTRDGDHYVVIASKGGAPQHPNWFHNLVANPTVTIEVHGRRLKARARVVEGAERERLYANQANLMPAFWEYQKKTERTIPVIVLERLSEATAA